MVAAWRGLVVAWPNRAVQVRQPEGAKFSQLAEQQASQLKHAQKLLVQLQPRAEVCVFSGQTTATHNFRGIIAPQRK